MELDNIFKSVVDAIVDAKVKEVVAKIEASRVKVKGRWEPSNARVRWLCESFGVKVPDWAE